MALERGAVEGKQAVSESQAQTRAAFGWKWQQRETFESESWATQHRAWMVERYCGGDPEQLERWLSGGRKTILDAGCGAGWSGLIFLGDYLGEHDYLGVDIAEDAVEVARQRFKERGVPGRFIAADLMEIPIDDGSVDMVFSEGVLHHTDDTGKALTAVARKLKPGGLCLFYVYAKKAILREYTDDHIRGALQKMSNEEAWNALLPLTKLGKVLGELNVELDVPEDIPYLGIKQGRLDIQRFFYWNICKAFYRENFTVDEMNHINFDWFRPLNCSRHTPDEVLEFCDHAGIEVLQMNVQEAGITVAAMKAQ